MAMGMLRKLVPVERNELGPVLLATAYGFCILLSYYILRPVRDEISSADRGNLQILWTVVFIVMLIAVPIYSSTVSRYSRGVFIPLANRFFAVNLLAFYAALMLLPETARPWIDRVFYVWASVFALFVVTVFWGFIADLFRNQQGRRLFGFIAVGSSLGGIVGSLVTASASEILPAFTLLLLAVVPLEGAARFAKALHRSSGEEHTPLRKESAELIAGDSFSGIRTVFRSPYLRPCPYSPSGSSCRRVPSRVPESWSMCSVSRSSSTGSSPITSSGWSTHLRCSSATYPTRWLLALKSGGPKPSTTSTVSPRTGTAGLLACTSARRFSSRTSAP